MRLSRDHIDHCVGVRGAMWYLVFDPGSIDIIVLVVLKSDTVKHGGESQYERGNDECRPQALESMSW